MRRLSAAPLLRKKRVCAQLTHGLFLCVVNRGIYRLRTIGRTHRVASRIVHRKLGEPHVFTVPLIARIAPDFHLAARDRCIVAQELFNRGNPLPEVVGHFSRHLVVRCFDPYVHMAIVHRIMQ